MTKKKKTHSKSSGAASASSLHTGESRSPQLHPGDIPRVRLFLCNQSDVKEGRLPALHVEVDPCCSLLVAVSQLQKICRSSKLAAAKPHSGHQWCALAAISCK
jgi:hypothetical protein